ncbi:hypothetical protein ABH940_001932 [Streptacidiphilus sp. BW17]
MEDLEKSARTSGRKRLDLSFTQVAASALAAVVGALLASQLGVYGTILGAAVVSAGATTGSALFQHVFRRTGEQLREISGGSVPLGQTRRVEALSGTEEPVGKVPPGGLEEKLEEKTQVFDPFDPGGEHTRMMAQINPPDPAETVAVYRGRTTWKPKGWRVYAITATLVFVIALGAVGAMELAVGKPAGQFFGGSGGGGPKPGSGVSAPADPSGSSSSSTSADRSGSDRQGQGNSSGSGAASSGTSASPSSSPTPTPNPSPSSSAGGGTGGTGGGAGGTSPSPGASSSTGAGSGTGGSAVSGEGVAPSVTPSP